MKLADIKVKEGEINESALIRGFKDEFPDGQIEVLGRRVLTAMGEHDPWAAWSVSVLLIIDKMTDEIWQWAERTPLEISGGDSWCIIVTGEGRLGDRISIRILPLSEINARITNNIEELHRKFESINERAASLVAEWTAVPTRKEDTI